MLRTVTQRLREFGAVLWAAAVAWTNDNAMRLSAAVAMYSILSISPLLIITIKVVSALVSEELAAAQIQRQVHSLLGPLGARAVVEMISQASRPGSGNLATSISTGILAVTASGVFLELQDALNTIWQVKARPEQSWWSWLRSRLLSMAMVFVIGFLLLVSQAVTTWLTVVSERVTHDNPIARMVIDTVTSVVFITLLFAMLFRLLPDVKIGWHDVALGAFITAVLFKLGQFLLAVYFRYAALSSAYGAAGSFVAVLLWVYYSSWILMFGAELTKAYAMQQGRWVEPEEFASPLTCQDVLKN